MWFARPHIPGALFLRAPTKEASASKRPAFLSYTARGAFFLCVKERTGGAENESIRIVMPDVAH